MKNFCLEEGEEVEFLLESFTKKLTGFGYFVKEVATNIPGATRGLVDTFRCPQETRITPEEVVVNIRLKKMTLFIDGRK